MNIEKAKNMAEDLICDYEDTPLCELPDCEFGPDGIITEFLKALGYRGAALRDVLSFGQYLPVSEFVESLLPQD